MSEYVPPSQQRRQPRALIIFVLAVGLIVAAAAGLYVYNQVSDRLDRERYPALKEENRRLFNRVVVPSEGAPKATAEERRRYDETEKELARIRAKHPDLR